MMLWRNAAIGGFLAGCGIATAMAVLVKLAARGSIGIWSDLLEISIVLFPTHIFLLPLSSQDPVHTICFFYLAAVIGNGIFYSIGAQIAIVLYLGARTIFSRLR